MYAGQQPMLQIMHAERGMALQLAGHNSEESCYSSCASMSVASAAFQAHAASASIHSSCSIPFMQNTCMNATLQDVTAI